MFNAQRPCAGGDDCKTDPCPTPSPEFVAAPLPAAENDHHSHEGVPCKNCQTNLFTYRHRILQLERERDWLQHSLNTLTDTAQRSKLESSTLYSQLLQENHTLKLACGVPEHQADIERGRVVSMVTQLPRHLEAEKRALDMQEQLRRTVAERHREQGKFKSETGRLRSQVGTLQDELDQLQKAHAEETETLRIRLHRLRHGAQVQELKRVAGSARNLRSSLNRLRATVTNMVDNSPLAAATVARSLGQIQEVATGFCDAGIMLSKTGEQLDVEPGAQSMLLVEAGRRLNAIFAASGGERPEGGAGGGAGKSSSQSMGSAPPSLAAAAPSAMFFPGPGAAGGGGSSDDAAAATALRDLCRGLSSYWGGFDQIGPFMELSETIDAKLKEIDQEVLDQIERKKKQRMQMFSDDEEAAGEEQKKKKDDADSKNDDSDAATNTPQAEELTESERLRALLYNTITSMLSEKLLQKLFGELERERNKSADLSRHLANFKQQLKLVRDGMRPSCSEVSVECHPDDPEFPLLPDSSTEGTGTGRDSRSRRGSEWTDVYGGRSSRNSSNDANKKGGGGSGSSRQRRGSSKRRDFDDSASDASAKSHMSSMSKASRYSSGRGASMGGSSSLSSLRVTGSGRSAASGTGGAGAGSERKGSTFNVAPMRRQSSAAGNVLVASPVAQPGKAVSGRRGTAFSGQRQSRANSIASLRSETSLNNNVPTTARRQPAPPTAAAKEGPKTARARPATAKRRGTSVSPAKKK